METIIDISNWEYFYDLQKNQIEVNSYIFILEYFLDNNIDISNNHYQYYEKKYIETYTNLFFLKLLFEDYLQTLIDTKITHWEINFLQKQVKIYND